MRLAGKLLGCESAVAVQSAEVRIRMRRMRASKEQQKREKNNNKKIPQCLNYENIAIHIIDSDIWG